MQQAHRLAMAIGAGVIVAGVIVAGVIVAGVSVSGVATSAGAQQAAAPVVAAAADLQVALPEIAALFKAATGKTVKWVFGSSGTFAQQIQNGAPFELFFSADEQYAFLLRNSGRTDGDGQLYAIGRIGLFVPHNSPIAPDSLLRGLAAAINGGQVQKFAIANPEHAPYGRAAQEALESLNLWVAVKPKLVFGENATQATQFATSGSAQGGIIPLSLALTPEVKELGRFVLIPAKLHAPLRQRMVLINGAGATARAFYDYLRTPAARVVLSRHGFTLPTAP